MFLQRRTPQDPQVRDHVSSSALCEHFSEISFPPPLAAIINFHYLCFSVFSRLGFSEYMYQHGAILYSEGQEMTCGGPTSQQAKPPLGPEGGWVQQSGVSPKNLVHRQPAATRWAKEAERVKLKRGGVCFSWIDFEWNRDLRTRNWVELWDTQSLAYLLSEHAGSQSHWEAGWRLSCSHSRCALIKRTSAVYEWRPAPQKPFLWIWNIIIAQQQL